MDQIEEQKTPVGPNDYTFTPVQKPERTYAGKAITIDGVVDVWLEGEKVEKIHPEIPEFAGYPKKWRQKHLEGFSTICMIYDELRNKQPERTVPMLMQEIEGHVEKAIIKDLESMGFIQSKLVQLMNDGKRLGGRVVVWFTPSGYALIKELDKIPTTDE